MEDQRTIAARLGGRWAISLRACVITVIFGSLILLAEGLSSASSPGLGPWLVLVLGSMILPLLILIFVEKTILRNRRSAPVSPIFVVCFNGFLGGLVNAGVWLGASQADISTRSASASSLITAVIVSMWWGSALTIFFDYQEQTRAERELLIDEAVRVEIAKMQQDQILQDMQSELAREVNRELLPLQEEMLSLKEKIDVTELEPSARNFDSFNALSQNMRSTSQGSLRPMSRELWERASQSYPRTPWWSVLMSIPLHQPFRPVLLIGIHITLTMWGLLQLYGLTRGLVLLSAESLTIFIVGVSFNRLMRLFPRHHVALFMAGIVAFELPVILRATVRESWSPGSATLSWQITQVLVGIFLIFLTSGISGWVDESGQLRDKFRSQTDASTIETIARSRQMAGLARETARHIHGSVQTRLVACAIAMDQATKAQDARRLNVVLLEALEILEDPLARAPEDNSIEEEVFHKAELWQGICKVEVKINQDVHVWPGKVSQVGLIVEEGLANAVRRGDATWVSISITFISEREILVTIEDDGLGPGQGPPGIGSAIIGQASNGNWQLEATAGGSRLTAIVTASTV